MSPHTQSPITLNQFLYFIKTIPTAAIFSRPGTLYVSGNIRKPPNNKILVIQCTNRDIQFRRSVVIKGLSALTGLGCWRCGGGAITCRSREADSYVQTALIKTHDYGEDGGEEKDMHRRPTATNHKIFLVFFGSR